MNNSEIKERGAFSNGAQEFPEREYTHRLDKRQRQGAAIRTLHLRLWAYLILVVLAGIGIVYVAHASQLISMFWILLPSASALSIVQSLAKNSRVHSRVLRIANFYELGIARLRGQWQGHGTGGEELQPKTHPYALDLNLFGAGSLFELLCTARTGIGRAMLANWLLNPADCGEVATRQVAIAELRGMLDFREEWASVEGGVLNQAGVSVRDWANAPVNTLPRLVQTLAVLLPICLIGLSMFTAIGILGHAWRWGIALLVALEALLAALFLKKTRSTAANLILPSFELALLAPLLERIETAPFQCPLLKSLQSRLTTSSACPSKQIRLLRWWTWLLGLRQIEYFALLSSPLLWGTNLGILIERWRQQNREGLATWLDSLGQFEALLCFARYHYENPDHTFAILKPEPSALFQVEALGHPLIDRQICVRCDLRLDAQGTQLIMVSGSNMSGKSTLVRSVGVNAVLAFAGAPVRATRLEISPLQIGCSMAIQDSLLQSKSRFQTEVERLKWILDLSRTNNVLFLLDEMLGGTNSNDRLWGAKAVIEQLAESGAIGLATTHDLALTQIVESLESHAINVHFEEHYENGEMQFDYKMRPGVLTHTNGLNVMAALGLLPGYLSDRFTPS